MDLCKAYCDSCFDHPELNEKINSYRIWGFRMKAYLVNKRLVKILEYTFTFFLVLNKNAVKNNVSLVLDKRTLNFLRNFCGHWPLVKGVGVFRDVVPFRMEILIAAGQRQLFHSFNYFSFELQYIS